MVLTRFCSWVWMVRPRREVTARRVIVDITCNVTSCGVTRLYALLVKTKRRVAISAAFVPRVRMLSQSFALLL